MKFLHRVFVLLLISTLVLESDAWFWSRRRSHRAPVPACSTISSPVGSRKIGCSSPYFDGDCCYYRCRSGYTKVSGSTTRTCCSSEGWTEIDLVCKRTDPCPPPQTAIYAKVIGSGCYSPYTHGTTCTYQCRPGYTHLRPTPASTTWSITCNNGHWIGYFEYCRRDYSQMLT
ncbi:complement decay-accelerating factor-like [Branchiostoma floridae x Branchiostoma japonicum]